MQTPALVQSTMQNIVQLSSLGLQPVVVHGGGPEISKVCQRMGITPVFANGRRVTDSDTLEIAQMVLVGKINKQLVCQLNQQGGSAVGLSGHDGNLMFARPLEGLGFVGEVEQVSPKILCALIQQGFIPVIAPIATSKSGQSYNVNADSAAASMAIELEADLLVLLTDVEGVLRNPIDPLSKIDSISVAEVRDLISTGVLKGGMIPKMEGALAAIQGGVREVHILDGRVPNALLSRERGTIIHA